MPILVAAFYRFAPVPDPAALQAPLRAVCHENDVLGTILVAAEGINGTISGTPAAIDTVFAWLRRLPGFESLDHQPTYADFQPFDRLKVRVKREIVTLRAPADPTATVGEYVDPATWNQLLDDPEVVVVDTRNSHEIAVGTFPGALDPGTRTFGEFPAWADAHLRPDQPVAMFCTGGIRCEKATSYLRSRGFTRVYHLQGGILTYLRDTPPAEKRWQGECFIFDQRFALDAELKPRYTDQAEARAHLSDGWAPRPAPSTRAPDLDGASPQPDAPRRGPIEEGRPIAGVEG